MRESLFGKAFRTLSDQETEFRSKIKNFFTRDLRTSLFRETLKDRPKTFFFKSFNGRCSLAAKNSHLDCCCFHFFVDEITQCDHPSCCSTELAMTCDLLGLSHKSLKVSVSLSLANNSNLKEPHNLMTRGALCNRHKRSVF